MDDRGPVSTGTRRSRGSRYQPDVSESDATSQSSGSSDRHSEGYDSPNAGRNSRRSRASPARNSPTKDRAPGSPRKSPNRASASASVSKRKSDRRVDSARDDASVGSASLDVDDMDDMDDVDNGDAVARKSRSPTKRAHDGRGDSSDTSKAAKKMWPLDAIISVAAVSVFALLLIGAIAYLIMRNKKLERDVLVAQQDMAAAAHSARNAHTQEAAAAAGVDETAYRALVNDLISSGLSAEEAEAAACEEFQARAANGGGGGGGAAGVGAAGDSGGGGGGVGANDNTAAGAHAGGAGLVSTAPVATSAGPVVPIGMHPGEGYAWPSD